MWLNSRIESLKKELELLKLLKQLIGQASEEKDLDSLPWKPFRDEQGEWIYENEAVWKLS